MVTNEGRREVAARLRGLRPNACFDDVYEALGAYGPSPYESRCLSAVEFARHLADLIEPQPITGDTSDGYHTFNELYDHRARLFSVVVRDHREIAWKSRLHHDDTMYDGMFIVGVETPQGQATYHYDIDPYWDIFDCKELVRAPEWDGHTPEQAISRIASLRPSCDRDALLAPAEEMVEAFRLGAFTGEGLDAKWCRELHDKYARRIREALGEGA